MSKCNRESHVGQKIRWWPCTGKWTIALYFEQCMVLSGHGKVGGSPGVNLHTGEWYWTCLSVLRGFFFSAEFKKKKSSLGVH
jgi:hypothetical protein